VIVLEWLMADFFEENQWRGQVWPTATFSSPRKIRSEQNLQSIIIS